MLSPSQAIRALWELAARNTDNPEAIQRALFPERAEAREADLSAAQRCLHEDYEDNLVVAAAQRARAGCLVTNDQNLLKHSPVAVLSCTDALAYLQALE